MNADEMRAEFARPEVTQKCGHCGELYRRRVPVTDEASVWFHDAPVCSWSCFWARERMGQR